MGDVVCRHEHFHSASGKQSRELELDVRFFDPRSFSTSNFVYSLLGGGLMLLVGLLYVAFEESIIAQVKPNGADLAVIQSDNLSKAVLGVQIGLVALAMVVTRSSVASLQAKTGLPLGTQIVSWAVFGVYNVPVGLKKAVD